MFSSLRDVCRTNVDNRAPNSAGGSDDNVIVLCDLECVEWLVRLWLVEYTCVDGVGHRVVDELAEDEAVAAFVEDLHGVGGYREAVADVIVAVEYL